MLKIIILLRFFDLTAKLFNLLTELLNSGDIVLFVFPLGLHSVKPIALICQFFLQFLESAL